MLDSPSWQHRKQRIVGERFTSSRDGKQWQLDLNNCYHADDHEKKSNRRKKGARHLSEAIHIEEPHQYFNRIRRDESLMDFQYYVKNSKEASAAASPFNGHHSNNQWWNYDFDSERKNMLSAGHIASNSNGK